jgi:hypothetical protein
MPKVSVALLTDEGMLLRWYLSPYYTLEYLMDSME